MKDEPVKCMSPCSKFNEIEIQKSFGFPSSHFLHSSCAPNFSRRPSSLKIHFRVTSGGLWRTCWRCPHSNFARQSPSSSLSKPTIFRFIFRANIPNLCCGAKPVSTREKSKAQSASTHQTQQRAAKVVWTPEPEPLRPPLTKSKVARDLSSPAKRAAPARRRCVRAPSDGDRPENRPNLPVQNYRFVW